MENLLRPDRLRPYCVQGLTLEKPEMVPFRLTQNIIDSFGPTGIEGVFRSVCSITLQVEYHTQCLPPHKINIEAAC